MRIDTSEAQNSRIIDGLTIGISASLFLAAAAGAFYTKTWGTLGEDFFRILMDKLSEPVIMILT